VKKNVGTGTLSMTIASPCVVTATAHGLVYGDYITFNSTGALPTGCVAGTLYRVMATGLTANSFQYSSSSPDGPAVNTSGTQSGTLYIAVGYKAGATGTAGNPFFDLQSAIDYTMTLDFNGFDVTIQLCYAYYTISTTNSISSWVGTGNLYIQGVVGTDNNTVIDGANCSCFTVSTPIVGHIYLKYMALRTVTGGQCVTLNSRAKIFLDTIRIGVCASYVFCVDHPGGSITVNTSLLLIQNYSYVCYASRGGEVYLYCPVTFLSVIAISGAFAWAQRQGRVMLLGASWVSSFTGTRFVADSLGLVYTGGQATTWIPGTVAGTTASGGQYA
jgi:hypothetical protein